MAEKRIFVRVKWWCSLLLGIKRHLEFPQTKVVVTTCSVQIIYIGIFRSVIIHALRLGTLGKLCYQFAADHKVFVVIKVVHYTLVHIADTMIIHSCSLLSIFKISRTCYHLGAGLHGKPACHHDGEQVRIISKDVHDQHKTDSKANLAGNTRHLEQIEIHGGTDRVFKMAVLLVGFCGVYRIQNQQPRKQEKADPGKRIVDKTEDSCQPEIGIPGKVFQVTVNQRQGNAGRQKRLIAMGLKVMRTAVNEHVGDGVALAVMHIDQYKEGRRFCAKETAKGAPH